jgi:hypothetical protein
MDLGRIREGRVLECAVGVKRQMWVRQSSGRWQWPAQEDEGGLISKHASIRPGMSGAGFSSRRCCKGV